VTCLSPFRQSVAKENALVQHYIWKVVIVRLDVQQGWPNLFCKGLESKILGFVGHTVSITLTLLCCNSVKAVIDNLQINGCSCVTIKLYLQK
jgi:hypothetical protein